MRRRTSGGNLLVIMVRDTIEIRVEVEDSRLEEPIENRYMISMEELDAAQSGEKTMTELEYVETIMSKLASMSALDWSIGNARRRW